MSRVLLKFLCVTWLIATLTVRAVSLVTRQWFEAHAETTKLASSNSTATATTSTLDLSMGISGVLDRDIATGSDATSTNVVVNLWGNTCDGDCATILTTSCQDLFDARGVNDGIVWLQEAMCQIGPACFGLLVTAMLFNAIAILSVVFRAKFLSIQIGLALMTICVGLDLPAVVIYHVFVMNSAQSGFFSQPLAVAVSLSSGGGTLVLASIIETTGISVDMGAGFSWALGCIATSMSFIGALLLLILFWIYPLPTPTGLLTNVANPPTSITTASMAAAGLGIGNDVGGIDEKSGGFRNLVAQKGATRKLDELVLSAVSAGGGGGVGKDDRGANLFERMSMIGPAVDLGVGVGGGRSDANSNTATFTGGRGFLGTRLPPSTISPLDNNNNNNPWRVNEVPNFSTRTSTATPAVFSNVPLPAPRVLLPLAAPAKPPQEPQQQELWSRQSVFRNRSNLGGKGGI